jgi:hypothetical protein
MFFEKVLSSMPRAYFINPENASIEEFELNDGIESIKQLIGQDSIDSDEVGRDGDLLFFDEACFIRAKPDTKRFKLDTLPPVAGRGVFVGSVGNPENLQEPSVTLEAFKARVVFS